MAPSVVQHYVHPLALDSVRFLNSLELYGQKYNQIGPTLCDLLRDVVFGIEKFLKQNPQQIVASEKIKLVQPKEFPTINTIYHCNSCNKDLGKSADKAAIHLAEQHRYKSPKELRRAERRENKQIEQKRRETTLAKLPKKAKAILMSDMAKFFADQLNVAEYLKQIPEYEIIESTLSPMLKQVFPDKSIKLYKFGSRMTGIGTLTSDLDIYIEIDGQFNKFEQSASQETLNNFDRIHDMVKKSSSDWSRVIPIRGARVPIIRMKSRKTNIGCDIGFSNSLSYCNTQLLQYIFQQQPLARRLCIFMKKWLERTKLNERITTYCMSLMVIYYLQTKNALPSIYTLQKKNTLSNVWVGPWIGNFSEVSLTDLNMPVLDVSSQNCKQHIEELCKFYAQFNYESQVVCPYFGRLNIAIKNIESLMPERYTNFVKSENSPKDCGIQLKTHMVVQDPLQLNHNVAARVTKSDLKEWKDYLAQSAAILAELK
ncbi:terminal uridylyltransferase Tailor [Eurosta solidaginis]|uniref:terminal uridylyltransferase Tailor n=1 Tax=Eurosta solidaginis TaxID=178769 RepID=UPI00353144A0